MIFPRITAIKRNLAKLLYKYQIFMKKTYYVSVYFFCEKMSMPQITFH